ncbi:hypothetical protein [Vibrio paracholerae]|uniref:hypothetical protein n=2 Tax=Vibrio TaxID=662 RepID=UPI0008938A7B|nr:hypothetical protein [Vibrio paracholerae]OFJ26664.1 hypothetical protein BFX31_01505 [Vibrio paracholerae]WOR01933.1 hypothetical protein R4537_17590 [Vibrio paracholerae]
MKSNVLNNILISLCLVLLIFQPSVPYLSSAGAVITVLISLVKIIFSTKSPVRVKHYIVSFFVPIIIFYFLILFYSAARVLLDGLYDISFFRVSLNQTIFLIAVFLFVISFDDYSDKFEKYIFILFVANLFYAVLAVDFFPSLLDLAVKVKGESSDLVDKNYLNLYRIAFFGSDSHYGISALYSLALVCFSFYMKKANINSIVGGFFLLFLAVAGVIAGRTAFIFILVSFFILLRNSIKITFLFLFFSSLSIYLVTMYLDLPEHFVNWMFELFINLSDGKGVQTESSNHLLKMYSINIDVNPVFGNAKFLLDNGSYYGGSDVGYIRHFLFGGFLICILIYLLPVIILLKNKLDLKIMIAFLSMYILELKGSAIYETPMMVLFIIISFLSYKEKQNFYKSRSVY